MKRFTILLIFILIGFTQCKNESRSDIQEIRIDFSKDRNIPINVISDVQYIPLETNHENVIGKISKLIVTDDRIYILDAIIANCLFIFDSDGDYLFKIQRIGKGPGEYTELNDFTLYEDKIILLGYKSILFFDLDGIYLYTKNIKWIGENIIFKNKKEVYLFQNSYLDRSSFVRNHIIKTDLDFRKHNEYFPPVKQEFHDYYRFQRFGNSILLSTPQLFDNIIYNVTNVEYHPFIKFNFIDHNIPEEYLENSISQIRDLEYPILRNTIITKDLVYFLFSFNNYFYLGLHLTKQNKTFTGKLIDGVTISQPIIYDIKDKTLYTYVEAFYFLNPLYYNKNSDIKEHNNKISNLLLKNDFNENSNPVIIRYILNEDLLE